MKKQSKEWTKIFAYNIFDKWLIFKIYKNSYNTIAKNKQLD